MGTAPAKEVTRLLVEWKTGNKAAMDSLVPLIYGEMHRLEQQRRVDLLTA